jgi:SH3 domain-containing YSC84-like protein 1
MRGVTKLVNFAQVSEGTLAGSSGCRRPRGRQCAELRNASLLITSKIPFLCAIAQTPSRKTPNLRSTLCASVRGNELTLRMGRKKVRCMKKLVTLVALFSLSVTIAARAETREDVQNRMDNAALVLHQIMATPDKGIPEEVLEHAKCVAIVPHMIKGGFVFGAENGRGVATCRTAKGWSAPAFFAITGGSWGLQIGVEGVDVVMIFQGDRGMQRLEDSNFKVGADASAAAGPVGRNASAGTDWNLNTQVLTYSRAKGAFAGLTLSGANVRQDNDSMRAYYGHHISSRRVLRGQVATPAGADRFLNAVRGAKVQALASN